MNETLTPQYVPAKRLLYAPTVDAYGTRLALVFGNESKTGVCPYYGNTCLERKQVVRALQEPC